MKKLPRAFYARPDVVAVARELLGKVLVTRFDGIVTSGVIAETGPTWVPVIVPHTPMVVGDA